MKVSDHRVVGRERSKAKLISGMAMVVEQAGEAVFRPEDQVDASVLRKASMDNLLAGDNGLLTRLVRLRETARQQAGETGHGRSRGGSMAS